MADNTTITPGTGATVAADDVGGALHQRVKATWGPDGTGNDIDIASGKPLPVQVRSTTGLIPFGEPTDAKSTATDTTSASGISIWKQISASVQSLVTGTVLAAGTALIGKVKTKFIVAAASAYTRPANTTAYTANDAVSNNGTAGSVTAISLSLSDVNDDTVTLERIRILSTDTGVQGKNFRVWLFNSDPTANSGVGGGDNAAWSQKQAGFIGSMSGTFRAFSDGAGAVCIPDEGTRIITAPVTGAKTVFALLQTLDAFTPSANSTTFTLTAEGFQGAA
jgi:hypothetical protein